MLPYGNSRQENLTCSHGCCTRGTKKTRRRRVPQASIRRGRKAARRKSTQVINEGLRYYNSDYQVDLYFDDIEDEDYDY